VISNGIQVGEALSGNNTKTTHWKETVPLPVKVMVIGVARFAIELAGVADGTPVYSWVYPEDRIKGFYDYALAREIIPWFNKTIAPYPFRKLASVQSTTMFGGMENASAVFYSENSIRGNRSNEALLTHEIAHQWFGNSATESSWQHVWLSEGFATYLTHMYLEDKYGNDSLLKRMRADRKEVLAFGIRKPGSVIDTSVRSNFITLLNTDTYQKGGWILHMLRNLIGEENFRKGIRQYYATYKGKNASTEDFQKVMQSLTKHDLGVFFKQWLYTPGNPDLQVSYTYDQNQKEVIVEVVQLQETAFTFPLDIEIVTSTKKIPGTYMVKGKKTILRVHSDQEPDRLILDPGVRLLFSEVKNQ
jgi:aminopeptidase N